MVKELTTKIIGTPHARDDELSVVRISCSKERHSLREVLLYWFGGVLGVDPIPWTG